MNNELYFPEELNMLRDQIRRFIEAEVMPHAEVWVNLIVGFPFCGMVN